MEDLERQLKLLETEVKTATERLKIQKETRRLEQIRQQMSKADFWKDQKAAQDMTKEEAVLRRKVEPWLDLDNKLRDIKELLGLKDQSLSSEIGKHLSEAQKEYSRIKKNLQFQGPYDERDVILSI